jgi:hypothetical protein
VIAGVVALTGRTEADPPAPTDSAAVFDLEVSGSVLLAGSSATSPLVATTTIHDGDRVYITVKTSKKATIFVAYCDTEQHMSIYPPKGDALLVASPDTPVRIPREDYFTADKHKGTEGLFVIAASVDIDQADPRLAEQLKAARDSDHAPSCEGSAFGQTTEASRALAKKGSGSGAQTPRSTKTSDAKYRPRGFSVGETREHSSTRSDASGFAVWPHGFTHQ